MLPAKRTASQRRINFLWHSAFVALVAFYGAMIWLGGRASLSINSGLFPSRTIVNTGSSLSEAALKCVTQYLGICFVKTPEQLGNSFFGFAEFMTALALLVVLYTISDVRYRFRVAVTPLPLFGLTYVLLGVIGLGSLSVDLWYAVQWPTPSFMPRQAVLQATFGGLFLLLSMTWIFYGFISPSTYGRHNYRKFASVLYSYILRGSDQELPIIAAELARSAKPLIKIGTSRRGITRGVSKGRAGPADYAHDIALLIGSRKFCRHVVGASPGTAIAIFEALRESPSFNIPLGQFAKNIATEAILNKDSPLYHEDHGFSSGLIGYLRPFSNAVFGNYKLVESLGSANNSPLDIDYKIVFSWDASQFEAFSGFPECPICDR